MSRKNRYRSNQGARLECLEGRVMLAADVLSYHNDVGSTGQNLAETVLTRANVNVNSFAKLFSFPVAGQIYAQPLVKRNVNITAGANAGVHDVVFVATQHDQLYALDAGTLNGGDSPATAGQLLWQHNFLDVTNPNNHLASATALTTVPNADVNSADITPEIGIVSTPVIDAATNTIYVLAKTKETVAGVAHWVQRLHSINIQDGTDRAVTLIGDTTGSNTNNTPIYVYGTGSGAVVDPYNGTGRQVVQFNALRQMNRVALSLVNGVVYAGWASHGDNGPYHGWMVGWDKNTLALKGVLNATPNGGLGGFWMAGGQLSFDGTYFYAETGNGTFDGNNGTGTASNPAPPAPGPITGLNAQGFPVNGDYGDSFLKIGLDPTTTATNQNINGWGLKVVDYFTPFNQAYLSAVDADLGSGGIPILPDVVGSAAHPHLLLGAGKEGVIYLIDRDNMGKYGLSNNVVQTVSGQSGSFDTPAYYNGRIYYVGIGGTARAFTIANGALSAAPVSQSSDSYAFAGSTPSISANGLSNGIVWDIDRGTGQLRAYSSDTYATELYTSAQSSGGRDAMGAAVKFEVPTAANGHVYVGAGQGEPNNALVIYGLIPPPTAVPNDPSNLIGTPVSATQINLAWASNAVIPNSPDGYYVEQSANGIDGWNQIGVAADPHLTVSGLTPATTYYFRVRAHDSVGYSGYANTASATFSSTSIDFGSGFGSSTGLTLNGGATVGNGRLHLTTNVGSQARSAFFNTQQDISSFTTTFTFTKSGTADGATFVIQRDTRGVGALGGPGGSLGYGAGTPITPSIALAINIYTGHPLGTEFLTNGTVDFNYSQNSINTSLDNTPIAVTISYSGGTLSAQLVQGTQSESKSIAIDLPTLLGGNLAWVGFTGATGGSVATQDITNWTFNTGTAPPGAPSQPDLTSASDSGLSDSDNITRDNTPSFSGIAAPGSTVNIVVGGVNVGSGTTSPAGIYNITTSALADGVKNATASTSAGGATAFSAPLGVTIDTVAPALATPATFSFQHAPLTMSFAFNEPIAPSLVAGDLNLINLTTGANLAGRLALATNAPQGQATWTISAATPMLADGNYTATISGGVVKDLAGNVLAGPSELDFFWLLGDLNHDRQVSISDFIDLASHFGNTGASWADGDVNFDGSVTISDFIDLAANFGKTLDPPLAAIAPQAAAQTEIQRTARRIKHHQRKITQDRAETAVWRG